MANHIVSATVNLVTGLLQGTIEFQPGLNLISGENGTLKTKLLQTLKGSDARLFDPTKPIVTQSISPKRNSERRAAEGILQFFRQNNRTWDTEVNERIGAQIRDTGFENYPSLGELFYLVFDHRCKDGGDRKAHMQSVSDQFNGVIASVFPHYALVAEWDVNLGAPRIRVKKQGKIVFPIEALSLGEQEILSLITSMDAAKDRVECYLIDEPEVHLNWHLEERLFDFIDNLCRSFDKQAIVVTHSRIIFKPCFLPRVQFLYWTDEGRIAWSRKLTPSQRRRLAGDALEVIALGEFVKPTFFVEDDAHSQLLGVLAHFVQADIAVSKCGSASNVRALFQHQRTTGGWPKTSFLIDGDNQGNPFPGDPQFFQLPAYSAENFYLDPKILATVVAKTEVEVQEAILCVLKGQRSKLFHNNKFLAFVIDCIQASDLVYDRLASLDGSLILDLVLKNSAKNLRTSRCRTSERPAR